MERTHFRFNLFLILTILFFSATLLMAADALPKAAVTPSTIKLIAVALLAIYEVIVRLIPSIGNYSLLSFIIKILKLISDNLQRRPAINKVKHK